MEFDILCVPLKFVFDTCKLYLNRTAVTDTSHEELMCVYVRLCAFMRVYVRLCAFMCVYARLCAFMCVFAPTSSSWVNYCGQKIVDQSDILPLILTIFETIKREPAFPVKMSVL